jgi:endonuclease/exonuclease/phosphatase family metal-dependent hydrolase
MVSWSPWLAMAVLVAVACGSVFADEDEASTAGDRGSVELRVMSSNVRYGTADDGPDAWPVRRERLRDCWREQQADIVGTQEMLPFQAKYLQEQFPEYAYVGRSREPENTEGEQCGIYYRHARFTELEQGHFWLSETPEVPGSRGWDAALPRMATWLKLYDRQKQRTLVVVNTHFDHRGEEARRESAALLARRIRQWLGEYPILITGDFNCGPDSPGYAELTRPQPATVATLAANRSLLDTYVAQHPGATQDTGTFHGFRGGKESSRIDWILVSEPFQVLQAEIIHWQSEGRYPSDHYPVTARLRW